MEKSDISYTRDAQGINGFERIEREKRTVCRYATQICTRLNSCISREDYVEKAHQNKRQSSCNVLSVFFCIKFTDYTSFFCNGINSLKCNFLVNYAS